MKSLIDNFNETHSCDDVTLRKIKEQMNCLDDEGKFLRYRANINDIEIYIAYSFGDSNYQIFFKNSNQTYSPKETAFTAKTCEILIAHVESELRNSDFSQFVGVTARKKIMKIIQTKGRKIFEKYP